MATLEQIKMRAATLHDAVVLRIEMQWLDGTVSIDLRKVSPMRLVVERVSRLECPREYPWGESECINEIRLGEVPGRGFRVEVEMQSGDVVVICGESVSIKP